MESIGDPSLQIWATYSILAKIAEARGDQEDVKKWRKKEREAYAAFPGHWENLKEIWQPIVTGINEAVKGDKEIGEEIRSFIAEIAKIDDWKNLAKTLEMVLEGERDADKLADEYQLDGTDYLILKKVVEGIE